MVTENLSTLKIHKLTQSQYDREVASGNIDPNALYLTPEEETDLTTFGVTVTATELNYMDGVTSNVQTQLDNKLSKGGGTLTGAINVNGLASMDTNGYVKGSWFQMTADTTLGSTPTEGVCVRQNGWIYTRTLSQIRNDISSAANADNQSPSTSLLRNSKLVSAETNPTVNGEICWTYK